MSFATIATSLEIDILQANELIEAFDLVVKNRIPAVVVHQDLISDALQGRVAKQGRFKIITPVDWPKGETFGMPKFQSMKVDALSTDGYEIFLTDMEHETEIKNEMVKLSEFIRQHLSPLAEIRFVLGTFTRESETIAKMAKTLKLCPAPAYVRNDHHTKAQQSKANIKVHQTTIEHLREHSHCPLKISGNVSLKTIASCQTASRFGVNLKQAQNIIKEAKQDPDKLHKLMSAGIEE